MAEYTLVADRSGELRLDRETKEERYRAVREQLSAVLAGEDDLLAAMTSVVCLLHNALPYYYWTGFYRRVGAAELLVGPYQGTLGCLRIPFERGVCGAAAREGRTQLVADVHAFPGHIACDAASASEIVVPVFDAAGELIAVLDVDSSIPAAFDEIDAEHLEAVVAMLAPLESRPVVATSGDGR
jgi:L-methionine (R)-S-oxide reductase